MRKTTWLRIAMIIVPVGVLTESLGARSIGNTVELTGGSMLVGVAASAQRVMRRRFGTV